MRLFSWLFRKLQFEENATDTISLTLSGRGDFSVEVVGESHYQSALKYICGNRIEQSNKIVQATLVYDDHNPHDNLAIRVDILNQTVGYLSRTHARYFRSALKAEHSEVRRVICPAKIVGGWDRGNGEVISFGVRLDLPRGYTEILPIEGNESSTFVFDLDNVNKEELMQCEAGNYVKLWKPSKDPETIYVYRPGTIGGLGQIGHVPRKYFEIIASHIDNGKTFRSKIVEQTRNGCKIECCLVSEEEISANLQREAAQLEARLTKKYTPQKGIVFDLQLPKNHDLSKNQPIYLRKRPIEYYVKQPTSIKIEFVDDKGNTVAYKEYETEIIRRLLRASFSGYELDVKILTISTPNKYLDFVEATAGVTFRKRL